MRDGQAVLAIYAAVLFVTASNLFLRPFRRQNHAKLPTSLRLAIAGATSISLCVMAWIGFSDSTDAIESRECFVWLVVLVEGLVFNQIAEQRDRGLYGGAIFTEGDRYGS